MPDAKEFLFEIITPEKKLFSSKANFVVLPGSEGELGVLPNHAALLSPLKCGVVKIVIIKKADSPANPDTTTTDYCAVSGGFVEIRNNNVYVLADTAEFASAIDKARAQRALEQAQEKRQKTLDKNEQIIVEAALQRALTRLKVASMPPA